MNQSPALRPGFFLTGNAWLDEDGEHVWIAHDCVDHREIHKATNLHWRAVGDHVEPSYQCVLCGFHAIVWPGESEQTADNRPFAGEQ